MNKIGVIAIGLIALLIGSLAWVNSSKQSINPNIVPFVRTVGQGGAINYETLSNELFLKLSDYLQPVYSNFLLPSLLTSNLIFYGPLDEGSGTTARDLSGQANTGTLTNGPAWNQGRNCEFGRCLKLTASSSQYVSIGVNSMAGLTAVSVCAWVNATTTHTQIFVNNQDSFDLLYANNGNNGFYLVDTNGVGSGYLNYDAGTAPSLGVWHFICGTWDGATMKLYIDGSQQTTTKAFTGTGILKTPANAWWGKTSGGGYFDGLIDDLRIYNVALTSAQILQLFTYGQEYGNTGGFTNRVLFSAVEAFLPNQIDSSISGTSISWDAEWDNNAVSSQYNAIPLGVEDAPGFANGCDFILSGVWYAQCALNNVATPIQISSPSTNTIHNFKITFGTAGSHVQFYVDNVKVATINSSIPQTLLSPFSELDNNGGLNLFARLWCMGGSI